MYILVAMITAVGVALGLYYFHACCVQSGIPEPLQSSSRVPFFCSPWTHCGFYGYACRQVSRPNWMQWKTGVRASIQLAIVGDHLVSWMARGPRRASSLFQKQYNDATIVIPIHSIDRIEYRRSNWTGEIWLQVYRTDERQQLPFEFSICDRSRAQQLIEIVYAKKKKSPELKRRFWNRPIPVSTSKRSLFINDNEHESATGKGSLARLMKALN